MSYLKKEDKTMGFTCEGRRDWVLPFSAVFYNIIIL
jgi:hypothetical protein